jgi:arachidonate 15-lipoxygenase
MPKIGATHQKNYKAHKKPEFPARQYKNLAKLATSALRFSLVFASCVSSLPLTCKGYAMSISLTLFPRANPTLPQNDSARAAKRRAKQLQDSQKKYQWTDTLPNVVGVPMAKKVPYYDDPSLPWLLQVGEVGLQLAENLLAVGLEKRKAAGKSNKSADKSAHAKLTQIRKQLQSVQDLQQGGADQHDTILIKKVITNTRQLLNKHNLSFSSMLTRFGELADDVGNDLGALATRGEGQTLADYESLFKTLSLPAIAQTFMDDRSFARYRVAGPNPMLIQGIRALPKNMSPTEAQYQAVIGAHDSLASALAEDRLFLLDYAELTFLASETGSTDGHTKYVFAPLALFVRPRGGTELLPVAIRCGQDPKNAPLFFPAEQNTANWWGWQMAKWVVQVAECNYHELFVHLARTHLVLEAFTVATHRQLAENHPVNILLLPHFIGTLFINNAAASFLIAPGGPIDDFFGAPIGNSQQAAGNDRLAFDFYANMLPNDLKRRRVDNPATLPDYPYRDDALLVWQTIEDWVDSYVALYYADDAAVDDDFELSAWADALISDGKLKGFTQITSRAQLVQVLTMVIFTASAQHAAVNFPQRPLMTYAPAISGASWQDAPKKQDKHTEKQWLALMPPVKYALEQLNILYLLGSVHYRVLGDYRSNQFPYLHWFEDSAVTSKHGPLAQFQAALRDVEETINARNTLRISYTFLLPSNIPNSINI